MEESQTSLAIKQKHNRLRRFGPSLILYLLATWFTDAYFMGDTTDYVASVVAALNGVDYKFWEFGHLLWRPCGWLAFHALEPITYRMFGADETIGVTWTLMALNWLAGGISVLLLRALIEKFCLKAWISDVVTATFILSNGFLNYAQTGCSYVPGLTFLLLSFYVLLESGHREDKLWQTSLLAGSALAGAILLWFLYIWAIPAVLALPFFIFGLGPLQRRLALRTVVIFVLIVGFTYAVVLIHLGIFTMAELRAWIAPAGAPEIKGFARMVFGFARSFINMGNDGLLVKRFLVHDPFNPVSLTEIFRLSLWKVMLFYLSLLMMVIVFMRSSRGKCILGLFLVNAIPVVSFAVVFLGGDPERYMPLYPTFFLALTYALSHISSLHKRRIINGQRFVIFSFIGVLAFSNLNAMAKVRLNRQKEQIIARFDDLRPQLKHGSLVVAVNWHDDLVSFNRNFPFDPINRDQNFRIYAVITPGSPWLPTWKQDFAKQILATWQQGGDVWISRRAFCPRPEPNWNWVEGDDKRISWNDIYKLFSLFETDRSVGGEDGFVILVRSVHNEQLLKSLIKGE